MQVEHDRVPIEGHVAQESLHKMSTPDTTPKDISFDSLSGLDELGRTQAARSLLDLLTKVQARNGLVIGLEGEWGSGKTWMLRQVETISGELPEDQRPVFVHFNPWMLGGQSEIVEAFLIQLASEVAPSEVATSGLQRGADIASKLIDYTRVLSTVKHLAPLANVLLPGSGVLLEGIGTASSEASAAVKDSAGTTLDRWKESPSKLSISAARARIVELLESEARRIVVIIDDLDRLAPADLGSMIQAVKAVADFPNLIYVLAYDPESTAHAIESAMRLPSGQGRKYLEKIVQLPFPLSEVPAYRMQAFAMKSFDRILGPYLGLESDRKDLDEALPRAAALMSNARDVIRLGTRLQIIAPQLATEINPADLLLAEALQLKASAMMVYVEAHRPDILVSQIERYDEDEAHRGHLGDPWQREGIDRDGDDEAAGKIRVGWRALLPKEARARHPIERAMAFLFDRVRESDWEVGPVASRLRIQRHRNWNRWRCTFAAVEYFENSEVLQWLAKPSLIGSSRAVESTEQFRMFCAQAIDLSDEAVEVDTHGFVEAYLWAAKHLGDRAVLSFDPLYSSWRALSEVLRKEPDQEIRHRAMVRLLECGSVWLSYPLIALAHRDAFGDDDRRPLDPSDRLIASESTVRELDESWISAAHAELAKLNEPDSDRPAFRLCNRILKLGGEIEPVRAHVEKMVCEAKRGLAVLFAGQSFTTGDVDCLDLGPLKELVPAADLVDALKRSPEFEESHPALVGVWRHWATQAAEQ